MYLIKNVAIKFLYDFQNTLVSRIMKRASESAVKRADDNEETLKTRIATFRENTEKILVQYPTQLRRVNRYFYSLCLLFITLIIISA